MKMVRQRFSNSHENRKRKSGIVVGESDERRGFPFFSLFILTFIVYMYASFLFSSYVRGIRNSKYYIFHCMKDTSVNKQKHSDRFVEKMKEKHDIVYYSVPDRGHCDLTDEMTKLYNKHIESSILDR